MNNCATLNEMFDKLTDDWNDLIQYEDDNPKVVVAIDGKVLNTSGYTVDKALNRLIIHVGDE